MKYVSNAIIMIGAVTLLSLGVYLAFTDKVAAAACVLPFAFLFVVLLLIAKFKRIKGFGFEAEMWEEKQEELVDDLAKRLEIRSKIREKIKETLHSGGPPGRITPEVLREILIDITDAV